MVGPAKPKLCLGCEYVLDGLPEQRCPECGRTFDLARPETYGCITSTVVGLRRLIAAVASAILVAGAYGALHWVSMMYELSAFEEQHWWFHPAFLLGATIGNVGAGAVFFFGIRARLRSPVAFRGILNKLAMLVSGVVSLTFVALVVLIFIVLARA